MAVTAYDLCQHLALEPDEYDGDASIRAVVDRCLKSATVQLFGAVGYHPALLDDPRAEVLVLENAADAYENRVATEARTTKKVYVSLNRMATDLLMQLRCDYGYPKFLGADEAEMPDEGEEGYVEWLAAYLERLQAISEALR